MMVHVLESHVLVSLQKDEPSQTERGMYHHLRLCHNYAK